MSDPVGKIWEASRQNQRNGVSWTVRVTTKAVMPVVVVDYGMSPLSLNGTARDHRIDYIQIANYHRNFVGYRRAITLGRAYARLFREALVDADFTKQLEIWLRNNPHWTIRSYGP